MSSPEPLNQAQKNEGEAGKTRRVELLSDMKLKRKVGCTPKAIAKSFEEVIIGVQKLDGTFKAWTEHMKEAEKVLSYLRITELRGNENMNVSRVAGLKWKEPGSFDQFESIAKQLELYVKSWTSENGWEHKFWSSAYNYSVIRTVDPHIEEIGGIELVLKQISKSIEKDSIVLNQSMDSLFSIWQNEVIEDQPDQKRENRRSASMMLMTAEPKLKMSTLSLSPPGSTQTIATFNKSKMLTIIKNPFQQAKKNFYSLVKEDEGAFADDESVMSISFKMIPADVISKHPDDTEQDDLDTTFWRFGTDAKPHDKPDLSCDNNNTPGVNRNLDALIVPGLVASLPGSSSSIGSNLTTSGVEAVFPIKSFEQGFSPFNEYCRIFLIILEYVRVLANGLSTQDRLPHGALNEASGRAEGVESAVIDLKLKIDAFVKLRCAFELPLEKKSSLAVQLCALKKSRQECASALTSLEQIIRTERDILREMQIYYSNAQNAPNPVTPVKEVRATSPSPIIQTFNDVLI